MKINDYIIKFEQLHSKAKSHKMEILDGVLAYRLLNSAGLSEKHKQLVRATVPEMKYDKKKEQLKKVFTNTCNNYDFSEGSIKVESNDSFYTQSSSNDCQSNVEIQGETQHNSSGNNFCGYTNYRGNYRENRSIYKEF